MYKFLNIFYRSFFFNKLNKFFRRKLFKIFKIFFVETYLDTLPIDNHPSKITRDEILNTFNLAAKNNFRPFISYPYILDILKIYSNFKKNISFYDFGANNLDLYLFLNNNLKNFTYYYYDQPQYNSVIEEIKNIKKIDNLIIDNKFEIDDTNLDFAYFGSAIQYLDKYEKVMESFSLKKVKYLIIAQTPFFISNNIEKNIIVKQTNLYSQINYLYIINYNSFLKFMNEKKFKLVSVNINRVIKFINFKNFSKKFNNIDMFDLVFKYDE